METHLKKITFSLTLLCLIFNVHGLDGPPFPNISEYITEFYQTEVEITEINQQVGGVVHEYYDNSVPRGKLDFTAVNSVQSVYYNNDTFEILEVNETSCQAWLVDESIFDYQPILYGWLNKNPLVIGPSAALWYADDRKDKIVYAGKTMVRNITCDSYTLVNIGTRENVTVTYHFADSNWVTPFQIKGVRVPIRIEFHGESSKASRDADQFVPIDIINDFTYFRPTITDWLAFQPPLGLGCFLKKPTRVMPKMPTVFKYSAEVFDVLKTDPNNPEYTYDVEYQQVWYDSKRMIARLDKFSRTKYFSELYDFNTGVTYSTVNGRTCQIKSLRNSFFEGTDGQFIGHLKEPGEVLDLDGSFYYMGKRLMRGIWCDSFESVKKDVQFMKMSLAKLVITIFYSQAHFEVAVDGETEQRIPVYYIVTGYDKASKKVINLQYNIFAFDDIIWPEMYKSYRLGRCFPSLKDKSYFIMIMDVPERIARDMEGKDFSVMALVKDQIVRYAKVSEMRIPLLRADYQPSGVMVTGLMLDRPPALKQFYLEFVGEVDESDPGLKPAIDADTKEKCAFACVDNDDYTCLGFYFCNKACFLKAKGIFEPTDDKDIKIDMGEPCQTWMRSTRDSTNKESYLVDALKSLEEAVLTEKVKINLRINDTMEEIIPINEIIIGDGPYTGIGQEKPYNIAINFAKLDKTDETTEEQMYVDNLYDCYEACKNSESLACASFSFCPDSTNKQCMLSSTLFVDRKHNPDGIKDDKNCFIYSMKYVDMYVPYPGKLALISGDDVISPVNAVEDCARNCRENTKINCRGFEYCRSTKTCVLHSKHVLDLKPDQIITSDKKSTCTHYAAKFTADYIDLGFTLIDDDSDVRKEITLEECAKTCSEELKSNCKSFNYCPVSEPYMTDSSCALSIKVLKDNSTKTTASKKCHHYEKKNVNDWQKQKIPDKKPKTAPPPSGYTSKGFTGLVIGMLVLGLIIGVLGFIGYSYYRSRTSGDGLSVRFMKQPT